jgi:hypothetical protein
MTHFPLEIYKFLADLPRTLQQQVTNFMCRDIIASLPILRNANNALLNALVECAEMNIYSPSDEIVKKGERPRGTILVAHGEVEVLKGDMVKRKMKRLDSFAEECLFVDKPTPFTVRSKGFSEIILIPSVLFQVSSTMSSQISLPVVLFPSLNISHDMQCHRK